VSKLLTEGQPLVIEDLDVTLHVTTYKYVPSKGPTIRSCWECNPAHEHLKSHALLYCYTCGHVYKKGVKNT
jgi:hypothetical protein